MKVLLINPNLPVFMRMPSLPLGLISIASYLKAHNQEIKIVERLVENDNNIERTIAEFKPDIIGISTMSFLAGIEAIELTKIAHKHNIPVVWGGQAATAMPELVFFEADPDYIILGEGEITWLELVKTLENGGDVSTVAGLVFKKNGELFYTNQRALADISKFPDIDWSLLKVENYFSSFFNCDRMLYIHASKGCPAQCTFCSNHVFHQSKNRCRNIDQIIRDIEYLYFQGANGIYFSDELWIPNKKQRILFCNKIIEKSFDLVWGCQMRLGVLDEEDINLMYKAGCRWILFGIESGNQERIDKIKKKIDLTQAQETIRMCESIGITVQASFIIGFPDETEKELKQTIAFAESLGASLVVMNMLIPLPNSEIYKEIRNAGIYEFPFSIRDMAFKIEQKTTDSLIINLSKVPDIDLKVIHFYYQWKAFSSADSVNNESYGIIRKATSDALNRIFKRGLKGFFYGTYSSIKQFSTVYFYSHMFKSILEKYGLK